MTEALLNLRRAIKQKKPAFLRQKSKQIKRLGKKWRKPKGLHSKLRLSKKGHSQSVSSGWRSPHKVRGLHRLGLKVRLIRSVDMVKEVNKDQEGIIIASSVGNKKRVEIIKKAKELGITLLHLKDPDQKIKDIESKVAQRKSEKEERDKEKEAKKKELEKKAKESKKDESSNDELTQKVEEEEKKVAAKKDKDKALTKKEI